MSVEAQNVAVRLAASLIDALAAKDFAEISGLLAPEARLRAIVPSRIREEEGREAIVERLRFWFEPTSELTLLDSEIDDVEGRTRFRYRFRGNDPETGWSVSEQTGFVDVEEGRITGIDLVCSGYRPVPSPT